MAMTDASKLLTSIILYNTASFDFKLYKTTDGTVERNNLKPIKSKSANPSEPYEYQFEMNPQNRYMIITLRQCRS